MIPLRVDSIALTHLLLVLVMTGMALLCPRAAWASGFHTRQSYENLRSRTLVVYNTNDPDARELATLYQKARSIAADHMLAIACPTTEEVSRADYNTHIRKPIEDYLTSKNWLMRGPRSFNIGKMELKVHQAVDNEIWVMALIRGIPLKIKPDPSVKAPESYPDELRPDCAAVDSELALLPFDSLPLPGFVGNLYYTGHTPRPFNQYLADFMILVSRLDGPTPDDVKRMIRDSLAAERHSLTGRAYFDTRNITDPQNPYARGDTWIRNTASIAQAAGFPVETDTDPATIPSTTPWGDVALYFGWYALHADGPASLPDFRFRPGAVAYHLHSFSASTLRDPGHHWAGPLIHHGAAATMGAVYEPYLNFTPELPIFLESLLHGLTFAEAAYQSQRGLSWMITVVGDPLYRPFPRPLTTEIDLAQKTQAPELEWLRLRRALSRFRHGEISSTREFLKKTEARAEAPHFVLESAAQLKEEFELSTRASIPLLRRALDTAPNATEKIRIGLKLAPMLEPTKALDLYATLLSEHPETAARFNVSEAALRLVSKAGIHELPDSIRHHLPPVNEHQINAP